MNLTATIESAELAFKQILEDFFVSVYDEKDLYSHGIDHHRRVWRYAREILSLPSSRYKYSPSCTPSKLIIACYLHDIGMSAEPGPKHGKHSRELGLLFLEKNNLDEKDLKDVLDTIEYHDRKDYFSGTDSDDLLTVLSVADDLDAFGFIGIYRYSEIYLTRGINHLQIGNLILENAKKRFDNFEKIFGAENYYVRKHRKRYDILCNFFIHYTKQAGSYEFSSDIIEGYCGMIQLFDLMIMNKMSLKELFNEGELYQDDVIIGLYLNGLKSELSSAT
jgi:hypothetical protein